MSIIDLYSHQISSTAIWFQDSPRERGSTVWSTRIQIDLRISMERNLSDEMIGWRLRCERPSKYENVIKYQSTSSKCKFLLDCCRPFAGGATSKQETGYKADSFVRLIDTEHTQTPARAEVRRDARQLTDWRAPGVVAGESGLPWRDGAFVPASFDLIWIGILTLNNELLYYSLIIVEMFTDSQNWAALALLSLKGSALPLRE